MVASFAINPAWASQQRQAAAQTDRIVAQTNQVVSNAIIANGKTLAAAPNHPNTAGDEIVKNGEANAKATNDAIDNWTEKAVTGTSTYVNPDTGAAKQLDNSYAHQYTNSAGQTFGTNSEVAPGPGITELQRVPAGQ